MIWLYRVLFLPALLAILPAYLRRLWRRGGFRKGFCTRLGAVEGLPGKRAGVRRIWIQAVSVGEILAIAPVIEALAQRSDVEVYLTTTTATGAAQARARYAGRVAAIGYFPVDFWPCSARAWRRIRPDLVVLTESEIWPEHLQQARRRGVPVLCINGRISDRSFARLRLVRPIARVLTAGLTRVLAGSRIDGERFRELLPAAATVEVVGSLKLDGDIVRLDEAERQALRRALGLPDDGLVLLGSSTWPGEEEALLKVLERARSAGVACSLVLVPRHAERRGEVEALVRARGMRYHLRSRGPASGVVDVAVGDTTGELRAITQVADLVYVGKSLPPHTEGQTPVEAAILHRPILFGPGMSNFREIVAGLVMAGAARVVHDPEELVATALALLRSPDQRELMAQAGGAWHAANRGAIGRTLSAISATLESLPSGQARKD